MFRNDELKGFVLNPRVPPSLQSSPCVLYEQTHFAEIQFDSLRNLLALNSFSNYFVLFAAFLAAPVLLLL